MKSIVYAYCRNTVVILFALLSYNKMVHHLYVSVAYKYFVINKNNLRRSNKKKKTSSTTTTEKYKV